MKPVVRQARDGERGFALLLVFLMAAAVALVLYQQMPRVAFESQRDKEQLLIDHGEQYKRAIQLYFIAFKKYPSKIEDLENTNNKRYLRRRFVDPMTGKDEWRLIHVNAAGALTDSLVTKPPPLGQPGAATTAGTGPNNGTTSPNSLTGINSGAGTNPNDPNQPPEVNAAVLRRPSDRPLVSPNGLTSNTNVDPNDPRYWPPISLIPASGAQQPGTPQQPGLQQTGLPQAGVLPTGVQQPVLPGTGLPQPGQQQDGLQQPGVIQPGVTPSVQPSGVPVGLPPGFQPGGFVPQFPGQQFSWQQFPGQQYPGQANPNPPSQITGATAQSGQVDPLTGQLNAQQAAQQAGLQGATGTGALGAANPGGTPANAALAAINGMLTTPRQVPAPVPDPSTTTMNAGGLAGVASTYASPSIKIYKDQKNYKLWEFIFDMKSGLPGQAPAAPLTPGQNGQTPGAPGQTTPGQNPSQSTFAPSTTFGPPSTGSTPSGGPQ